MDSGSAEPMRPRRTNVREAKESEIDTSQPTRPAIADLDSVLLRTVQASLGEEHDVAHGVGVLDLPGGLVSRRAPGAVDADHVQRSVPVLLAAIVDSASWESVRSAPMPPSVPREEDAPVKVKDTDAEGSPVNCHSPFPWLVQLPWKDRRESAAPTVWFTARAGCTQHARSRAKSAMRRDAAA